MELETKLDVDVARMQKAIRDNLNLAPSDFLQNLLIMQYAGQGVKNIVNNVSATTAFLVSEDFEQEINKIDSSALRKVLWWSEHFDKHQSNSSLFCTNLRLEVIKRARKEKNYKLAFLHIYRFMKDKNLVCDTDDMTKPVDFFVQKVKDVPQWTLDTARAISETIKW